MIFPSSLGWVAFIGIFVASTCLGDTFGTHIQWDVSAVADPGIDLSSQHLTDHRDGTGLFSGINIAGLVAADPSSFNPNYTHNIHVTGAFSAYAQIGAVGASLSGSATTTYSGPYLATPSGSEGGTITSAWSDYTQLDTALLPPGSPLTVTGKLLLSGTLLGDASDKDPAGHHYASYNASMQVKGLGVFGAANSGATLSQGYGGSLYLPPVAENVTAFLKSRFTR